MVAVSVIIPCFNCQDTIVETLDSLLHQTFQSFEVICIDNNSTDDSVATIRAYKERTKLDIKLIIETVKGPSAARNAGIKCASGDLVAFLDSDDLWEKEKLSHVIHIFENDPMTGLCHTAGWEIDQDGLIGTPFDAVLSLPENYFHSLLIKNCIVTSTVVVRKSILGQAGLFDENLMASEDWDLWIRIARLTKISYLSERLTLYRIHPSNTHQNVGLMEETRFAVHKKSASLFGQNTETQKYISQGRFMAHLSMSYKYRRTGMVKKSIQHAVHAIKLNPTKTQGYQRLLTGLCAGLLPSKANKASV